MLRLIERSIESIGEQLVFVAPPQAALPEAFRNVTVDSSRHKELVREMQAVRGAIYVEEGNVKSHQLSPDGRHETPEDEKSWHLLMTDRSGHVRSCALLLMHENTVTMDDLRVRHCPLAKLEEWRHKLRGAVEADIARARHDGLQYGELGGWAIAKERRGTPEGLMMALATYGLSQTIGGGIGMTTANVAHSCSAILQRMGGTRLKFEGITIPSFFDPRYNTEIDLLAFDSRRPNPKYISLINIVKDKLANVAVFANSMRIGVAAPSPDTSRMTHAVMAA